MPHSSDGSVELQYQVSAHTSSVKPDTGGGKLKRSSNSLKPNWLEKQTLGLIEQWKDCVKSMFVVLSCFICWQKWRPLWPVLQPTTRGQSRYFGITFRESCLHFIVISNCTQLLHRMQLDVPTDVPFTINSFCHVTAASVQPGPRGSVLQQPAAPGGCSHPTGQHQDPEPGRQSAGPTDRPHQALLTGQPGPQPQPAGSGNHAVGILMACWWTWGRHVQKIFGVFKMPLQRHTRK